MFNPFFYQSVKNLHKKGVHVQRLMRSDYNQMRLIGGNYGKQFSTVEMVTSEGWIILAFKDMHMQDGCHLYPVVV